MTFLSRKSWTSSERTLTANDTAPPKYGIKKLYEPTKPEDAVAEHPLESIVFVHGLKGDRERTWTAPGSESSWLETLLPLEIPDCRILTYGYDSNPVSVGGVVSSNTIGNHARNFLNLLSSFRAQSQSADRPIILAAHSMGGLMCEDALLASQNSSEPHLRGILECVYGILFLGTPHSGSGLATSAERLAKLIGLIKNTNSHILGVLRRDSEVLSRIQDDFHTMLRSRAYDGYPPIKISCCYEELPLPGIGEVVPKASATLHGYTAIGIRSNHRDMVRFSSPDDLGFLSITGELKRWIDDLGASDGKLRRSLARVNSLPLKGLMLAEATHQASGITIWGNVVQSNVVNGSQTVNGDMYFGA
ncbi:LipA and NB-ARC domain-containing protein [Apiospora rasikravindrae]|uniref:LipA and NB-ARC domain-containing protein n=1 Tax=Apiospora rasikravindrae TaxID=990691 RepID=A0ABR1S479_9PEZI